MKHMVERLHIHKAPPIKFDFVLFCSKLSVFSFLKSVQGVSINEQPTKLDTSMKNS
uniref:Uncharacterized protein n=1 Tax=Arundo donax TaxID=35708 RepID=A0A0A9EN78_ARUDO